jgi:hypothetical protein
MSISWNEISIELHTVIVNLCSLRVVLTVYFDEANGNALFYLQLIWYFNAFNYTNS